MLVRLELGLTVQWIGKTIQGLRTGSKSLDNSCVTSPAENTLPPAE